MRTRLLAVLLVLMTAACTTNGLALRKDHRVHIVSPRSQDTVRLPLDLRWTARGLPDATRFVVFVDRRPMKPGGTLRSLADDTCKQTPGCPNDAWLRERDVFVTDRNSLRLENVPADNEGERFGRGHGHEVTIVLLGPDGKRMGETSFASQFFVKGG